MTDQEKQEKRAFYKHHQNINFDISPIKETYQEREERSRLITSIRNSSPGTDLKIYF